MLKDLLIDALRQEYGGTTVRLYVPKRARVDWSAVKVQRQAGVPVAQLARQIGCSERLIYMRASLKK